MNRFQCVDKQFAMDVDRLLKGNKDVQNEMSYLQGLEHGNSFLNIPIMLT